jgi:hypothetical protein
MVIANMPDEIYSFSISLVNVEKYIPRCISIPLKRDIKHFLAEFVKVFWGCFPVLMRQVVFNILE